MMFYSQFEQSHGQLVRVIWYIHTGTVLSNSSLVFCCFSGCVEILFVGSVIYSMSVISRGSSIFCVVLQRFKCYNDYPLLQNGQLLSMCCHLLVVCCINQLLSLSRYAMRGILCNCNLFKLASGHSSLILYKYFWHATSCSFLVGVCIAVDSQLSVLFMASRFII